MHEEEFVSMTIGVLSDYVTKLDQMEINVRQAAVDHADIPNLPDMFKTIADTAHQCGTAVEQFWPDRLPSVGPKRQNCESTGLYFRDCQRVRRV